MARTARTSVSLTETLHYQRLVDFLAETAQHAEREHDVVLRDLVSRCYHDLLSYGNRS